MTFYADKNFERRRRRTRTRKWKSPFFPRNGRFSIWINSACDFLYVCACAFPCTCACPLSKLCTYAVGFEMGPRARERPLIQGGSVLDNERQGENTKLMLQIYKKFIKNDHDRHLNYFFWSQKRGGALITGEGAKYREYGICRQPTKRIVWFAKIVKGRRKT